MWPFKKKEFDTSWYKKIDKTAFGYKYIITKDVKLQTKIKGYEVDTKWCSLDKYGMATMKAGFKSDGPSWPAIDTKTFMRGAFWHDLGYKMMREGHISIAWRAYWDKLLRVICAEDKMFILRRWAVWIGVRKAAFFAASP